jgi:hypothetical protein
MAIIARAGRQLGQTRRLDRSLPAAAPGSAGSRSRSRQPAGQGTANHATTGNPMKPGASIGETRQPLPGGARWRSSPEPAGQIGQTRASRSPLPAAAPGSAGTRSRSRQPAGQGTANHATTANPVKPGASIGETRQPLPVAPDGDHRRKPPAGQIGQTRRLDRSLPAAAPGSAGSCSRSRQPAGQGTANHGTTANPMKPGASIGELDSRSRWRPMTIIARAAGADRANSASRSLTAGSGARFRRPSLAIPAAGRPKHRQPRDHGQPMKPGASIGETRQPLPVAPDGDHRRQSRPVRSGKLGVSIATCR